MHSHLIPEIDDGATSVEQSLHLIKGLKDLGYKKLIATPHVISDFYQNTPEKINKGLLILRNALKEANINIEIEVAAEYYLDFDFQKKLDTEELLTFGSNYLLFELPFYNKPQFFEETVFKMQTLGYKPVLAHPERFTFWNNDFKAYNDLKDRGVLLQININSLVGGYSAQARKIAEKLIVNNMVDFVGSDTHNQHHIELLKKSLNNKYLIDLIKKGSLLNKTL
ncbi:MAG: capsular biosynthesis protein [Bacteroidetes bacterium]|nr:capsular biosynthesis protein [Bacteroidota bacterium]